MTTLQVDVEPDPLQTEVLADGHVSHAEMERALLAVVSCLQEQGYDAQLDRFRPGWGHGFRFGDPATGDGGPPEAVADACQHTMLSDVEPVYFEEHGPTEEEIEAQRQRMMDCLVDRGYDRASLDPKRLMQQIGHEDFSECDEISDGS